MKLTPNEKNRIHEMALLEFIRQGGITYKESRIYSLLRANAFYSAKKKKRNLSTITLETLEKDYGFHRTSANKALKNLERAKLVEPRYHINSSVGGKYLVYNNFDTVRKKIGSKNIKFVRYKILKVPNELEMLKLAKKQKKLNSKN